MGTRRAGTGADAQRQMLGDEREAILNRRGRRGGYEDAIGRCCNMLRRHDAQCVLLAL